MPSENGSVMPGPGNFTKQPIPATLHADLPSITYGTDGATTTTMQVGAPGIISEQAIPATLHPNLPSMPGGNREGHFNLNPPGTISEQPVPATLYPNLPRKLLLPILIYLIEPHPWSSK